jgi:hypothetical protein
MKPFLNPAEVEQLLNRYLEAETTLEEEKQLRLWFSTNEIPSHWAPYHSLFSFLSEEHSITYPNQSQKPTMEARLAQHKNERPRRRIYLWTSVAAATVLVALGLNYMRQQQLAAEKEALLAQQNELNIKSFEQIASALMLVSETLNKGMAPVEETAQAAGISQSDNAMSALGSALMALNKVTNILIPSDPEMEEESQSENSGI